jgi:hypothetical protein
VPSAAPPKGVAKAGAAHKAPAPVPAVAALKAAAAEDDGLSDAPAESLSLAGGWIRGARVMRLWHASGNGVAWLHSGPMRAGRFGH